MKQKEKEYLIAFKLYIDHYDPRYRYPKWIRAINKKDAITKYIQIIKPDAALGACIIMDERPVKQDETKEVDAVENHKNINDVYREGNLKLLEMMISQLNKSIDPANPDLTPRQFIIDMDEINKELCSTSRLVNMLSSGVSHDKLPYNGYIYTDDFFEHVNDYMNTRYQYEFYEDYTLMQIRADLQRIYDCYSKHGVLPWQDNKEEEETETLQEEDVEEMKESIVKGERTNTTERVALDILDHEPIFDIEAAGLNKGYAYLLEKFNDDGSVERKVIVIIDISPERIVYIWRETSHDTVRREGTLTPRGFENGKYKLYPITAEDIK